MNTLRVKVSPALRRQVKGLRQVIIAQHSSTSDEATATTTPAVESANYLGRFKTSLEVTFSKIFPAGFGWQASSIVAGNMGLEATDIAFAATTGLGDACGVLIGHTGYYALKSAMDPTIDMTQEFHTGIFLASAAFCSGAAWQPTVNLLQGANFSFNQVVIGTTLATASAFYIGLRGGRSIYSNFLKVAPADYDNLRGDAQLSLAIGGACGAFVGTDTAYLVDQNYLKGIVGIDDADADLLGCVKAGSSTALGFNVIQTGENLVYPAKKVWTD